MDVVGVPEASSQVSRNPAWLRERGERCRGRNPAGAFLYRQRAYGRRARSTFLLLVTVLFYSFRKSLTLNFYPSSRRTWLRSRIKVNEHSRLAPTGKRASITPEYLEIVGHKDFSQLRLARIPQSAVGVTAVIPTKGPATFLNSTLTSLALQTYPLSQIILVDDSDADIDANLQYLSKICQNFECRILRNEGSGVCKARNTGARHTKTEFLLFIDSDDLFAPTFVESAILLMTTVPRVCAVKGWMKAFGNRSYEWRDWFSQPASCKKQNCVTLGSLHRTTIFKRFGGFDDTFRNGFEDWDLWLRYIKAGCPIYQIPIFADYVRIRPQYGEWWLQSEVAQRSLALIEERHADRRTYKWDVDLNIRAESREALSESEIQRITGLFESRWVSNASDKILVILDLESWYGLNCLKHHLLPSGTEVQLTFAIMNVAETHHRKIHDFEEKYHDVLWLGAVCPEKCFSLCLRHLIFSRLVKLVLYSNGAGMAELVHEALPALWNGHISSFRCQPMSL